MATLFEVLRAPVVTEKATTLKDAFHKVTFEVGKNANKKEIKRAIETFFEVKVENVNTSLVRGKNKRVGKSKGKQHNWKKAVVSLDPTSDLDVFGIVSVAEGVTPEGQDSKASEG